MCEKSSPETSKFAGLTGAGAMAPDDQVSPAPPPFSMAVNYLRQTREGLVSEVNRLNVLVSQIREANRETGGEWRREYNAFRYAEDAIASIDNAISNLGRGGSFLGESIARRKVQH